MLRDWEVYVIKYRCIHGFMSNVSIFFVGSHSRDCTWHLVLCRTFMFPRLTRCWNIDNISDISHHSRIHHSSKRRIISFSIHFPFLPILWNCTFLAITSYHVRLQRLLETRTSLTEAVEAARRVFGVIDREPKTKNYGFRAPEHLTGKIEFKNITFSYQSRPDTDILQVDISINLKYLQILVDNYLLIECCI